MDAGYEFVEHTADYAIRVWAEDFPGLIEKALEGLIHLMADVEGLSGREARLFEVSGESREQVLVRALRELLLLEDDGLLPVRAQVIAATDNEAHFEVSCMPLDEVRDRLEAGVKAVTYHDLHIRQTIEGLAVDIVFDT
ncbi:MAG: archease [Armatimonadetes bacterium]|nr:archease [Armatimonadota bacterium]